MSINLTDDELERLRQSNGIPEWDSVVEAILDKRNGKYPPDWYQKVIANPEIDTTLKYREFDSQDDLLDYLKL